MSIIARAWNTYQQLLVTNPWKTQIIGTGILVAVGDVITQQFVEKKGSHHDFVRTARMGVVGVIVAPVLRTWFLALDRIFPGTAKIDGLKKMLLDQSLFAPFMIGFFFSVTETLAGKRPYEIHKHRIGFVQLVAIFWNAYMSWMVNLPLSDDTVPRTNDVESMQ
ncbi:protein Mpv17-like isoform X2 [Acropora muricata]|uniref:protein Mpv17-like isoform X2 n=1 Tax=Acropora muricata TaxID=159855 RepID=UPI0034E50945